MLRQTIRNQLIILACVGLGFFLGCQESAKKTNLTSDDSNEIPQVMAGVWEANIPGYTPGQFDWGIKFEPDGSITKIIHSLVGPVDLSVGGIYDEGPEKNTYAMFVMGPCEAKYNKKSKVLNVKIVLDYYEMQLPNGKLSGKVEDRFSGKISRDGKTWKAKWYNYGWLEGAEPPDIDLINKEPMEIVFHKVDLSVKPNQ